MTTNKFLTLDRTPKKTANIIFKIAPSQKASWEFWLEKVGVKDQDRSAFYRGAIRYAIEQSIKDDKKRRKK